MKRIYETWMRGWLYLLGDDLVSFYVFFTLSFAGCAWLYRYCELAIAITLSLIMFANIGNVMIFAWLKGNYEGTRLEKVFSICYCVVFGILMIIGLVINWKIYLIMMVTILVVTAIAVLLRRMQAFDSIQAMIFCVPVILLSIWVAEISSIPLALKIVIPVVYLICVPYIAYYEDYSAAQNIFELAYDNSWDPEYEERMRELNSKDIVV